MWTRKAVTYTGFGTILVLFAPFINNLQLLLLGITLLGFVAVHSLVNTSPVRVNITRRFSDSQIFELRCRTPQQAEAVAAILGDTVHSRFPWSDATTPHTGDVAKLILASLTVSLDSVRSITSPCK